MKCGGGILPAFGTCLLVVGVSSGAIAASAADTNNLTDLEQVTVYSSRTEGSGTGGLALGGTTVTLSDMQQFNRDTLDRAFVLASGTSVSLLGQRNETDIWIRGFDRWRVPLYQDGIPVYLPYDDRIDFARFSTIDLASIQISKGFASVIDGPGAMGGSVNMVNPP